MKTKIMYKTVPPLGLMIVQAVKFITRDLPVKDMFYNRTDGDGWVGRINPSRSYRTSKGISMTWMKRKDEGKINVCFQYCSFPFFCTTFSFPNVF